LRVLIATNIGAANPCVELLVLQLFRAAPEVSGWNAKPVAELAGGPACGKQGTGIIRCCLRRHNDFSIVHHQVITVHQCVPFAFGIHFDAAPHFVPGERCVAACNNWEKGSAIPIHEVTAV
jgi:hypothetical protein